MGEGLRVREKTLTLPKGTVMASKRKLLIFKENGWCKQRLKEAEGRGACRGDRGRHAPPWTGGDTFLSVLGTHSPPSHHAGYLCPWPQ